MIADHNPERNIESLAFLTDGNMRRLHLSTYYRTPKAVDKRQRHIAAFSLAFASGKS
jgi:hypothetical protein